MEPRYLLYTWPESKAFIGQPGCIQILPSQEDFMEGLEDAYLVPEDISKEIKESFKKNNLKEPVPEDDTLYLKRPNTLTSEMLYDYDGNIFIPETTVKKNTLKVVYGEAASRFASDNSFDETVKQIEAGDLDGSYATYEFDTEKDRNLFIEALQTHDGWLGNYFETDK